MTKFNTDEWVFIENFNSFGQIISTDSHNNGGEDIWYLVRLINESITRFYKEQSLRLVSEQERIFFTLKYSN